MTDLGLTSSRKMESILEPWHYGDPATCVEAGIILVALTNNEFADSGAAPGKGTGGGARAASKHIPVPAIADTVEEAKKQGVPVSKVLGRDDVLKVLNLDLDSSHKKGDHDKPRKMFMERRVRDAAILLNIGEDHREKNRVRWNLLRSTARPDQKETKKKKKKKVEKNDFFFRGCKKRDFFKKTREPTIKKQENQ
jgi:hypothetical protein